MNLARGALVLVAAGSVASSEGAEIAERELELAGKKLHYLEAGVRTGECVLLLHGARYSSETWRDLGTIEALAGAGACVIALDLPGYGRSQTVEVERNDLLVEVLDALSIDQALVVSPSMSGRFSFPLVTRAPERVSGFVPIAPAGLSEYLRDLRKVSVRALVIWGEKDAIVPLEQSDVLAAALTDSRRVIMKGASHACYLDRPDEFHRELLTFVKNQ